MSEIFRTTQDAIDILNEARLRFEEAGLLIRKPPNVDRVVERFTLILIHAIGHLACTCIKEETE